MRKVFAISVLLIVIAGIGCEEKQHVTQLEVGRGMLLGAGLTIEAVEHLKRAEVEEKNKVEPRALLLIAYSHALATGDAQSHGVAEEYKQERAKRLTALNQPQMLKILNLINERHRTQQTMMQILIDKGTPAVPLLIESLGENKYAKIQADIVDMLYQIGSEGVDQITAALNNSKTPSSVKVTLVQLLGKINDRRVIPTLEAMRNTSDAALKMEIDIALYQLGEKEYRSKIIAGLDSQNVAVRRAAAASMVELNETPTDQILKALKDADAKVRLSAVQTLEKYPTPKAVDQLIEILKSDPDEDVKQAAAKALIVHAQHDFGKNLALRLIEMLPQVSEPKDRLRIVQVLKTDAFQKQIKTASPYDNLEYKLDQYYRKDEENEMVKEELARLLNALNG